MSIDAGAHVVIILLACGPCEVIVNCLGHVLYLGRAPRTKETLPDLVSGYPTSTSIPWVDGLLTDPRVLGRHKVKTIIIIIIILKVHIKGNQKEMKREGSEILFKIGKSFTQKWI